jgi:UDP-N-acetylmuramoylalanine--D-glutamate ligase
MIHGTEIVGELAKRSDRQKIGQVARLSIKPEGDGKMISYPVRVYEAFFVTHLTGKRVVILGAARQGIALARFLARHGAQVVLNDRRPAADFRAEQEALADLQVAWVCGDHPLSVLDGADQLCLSGGVPLNLPVVVEAQRRGIPLTNDSQIFLETAPCQVIGITGSAGKTTTTTLVGRMAEAARKMQIGAQKPASVYVGGNIGTPLISFVDGMTPEDLAVMELSSFQLEIMSHSPEVAAVLNVTPNHLDRHGTMQSYMSAKARILDFQGPEDAAVLGREDPIAWKLASRVRGRLLSFGLRQPAAGLEGTYLWDDMLCLQAGSAQATLFPRRDIQLRGEHNLLNVLAACAIAAAAGLPVEAMQAGVEGFGGVPHRLEFVRSWGGAAWYNDSIATAPERSIAAIRSFDEPLVLLAGGRDKNLPWDDFAALVRQRVDHLILFGETAEKIARAMEAAGPSERPFSQQRFAGLHEAVLAAAKLVKPGDVVLLSPGGTSFDEFHDFEERGEWYRKWVLQL